MRIFQFIALYFVFQAKPVYPQSYYYQPHIKRQETLQGQFVNNDEEQPKRNEVDEFKNEAVPVVITGLKVVPQSTTENPAFSFDNDTQLNLDGAGYALSILLIGQVLMLAMAFFVGGYGFSGLSFSFLKELSGENSNKTRTLDSDKPIPSIVADAIKNQI